jgi:ActR/RegA family two-component response regulator
MAKMADAISLLFVDDEDSIRVTLPPLLERHGFAVTTAASVPEALNLIAQREFQVLLTDLNIGSPGDGFAIVSAMRSSQPSALRLILTGYPAFETALEAIRQQVDDYVVKPADTENLVQVIRSKFGKRAPARLLPPKRLPEIIQEQHESIIKDFLEQAASQPELSGIRLSEVERADHIPRLLEVTTRIARDGTMLPADMEASALHGTLRRKQHYTIPMLIREAGILKDIVADCLQNHLLEIDISFLIRDMVSVNGTIDTLLEASIRAFLQPLRAPQEDKKRSAGKNRSRK